MEKANTREDATQKFKSVASNATNSQLADILEVATNPENHYQRLGMTLDNAHTLSGVHHLILGEARKRKGEEADALAAVDWEKFAQGFGMTHKELESKSAAELDELFNDPDIEFPEGDWFYLVKALRAE